MTLSFSHIVFSQLRYLVHNLSKKNYKQTVTEANQVVRLGFASRFVHPCENGSRGLG